MFDQFRNSGVRTQAPAAGHNDRREALPIDLRGACGAVSVKIVVTEDHDGVRALQGVFNHPTFAEQTKNRMPSEIEDSEQEDHRDQRDQRDDNSACLARISPLPLAQRHVLGSNERSCSAACPGSSELKATSLMLSH